MIEPASEAELAEVVSTASQPFAVQGLGTKSFLGRRCSADQTVSLNKFSGVSFYEPSELVIEAGPATPLDEIEALVHSQGQRLAFEPPDYRHLLTSNARGSIGSVLACNLSGPRRLTAGAARDHILGVRGVSGRGEIFKAGGRVVKNVTGYDIAKLMAGSFGTLAALTSVTFKVLPNAETEITLLSSLADVVQAGALMRLAMQLPHDVSCAAHVPGLGTGLRVEGIGASVADRKQSLLKALPGSFDVLDEVASKAFWEDVANVRSLSGRGDQFLWRISVAPTDGPSLAVDLAKEFGGRFILDWSGGLIWLETQVDCSNFIRSRIKSGNARLFRAPAGQPPASSILPSSAVAALSHRVKHAFDPKGLFNPGRLAGEW